MQFFLSFSVQALRRKYGVYFCKVSQGDDEWNYKWRKGAKGDNPKNNTFVCEIRYSKYQLTKSMYKIITSMFLQKSLGAHRNSGIHPN